MLLLHGLFHNFLIISSIVFHILFFIVMILPLVLTNFIFLINPPPLLLAILSDADISTVHLSS